MVNVVSSIHWQIYSKSKLFLMMSGGEFGEALQGWQPAAVALFWLTLPVLIILHFHWFRIVFCGFGLLFWGAANLIWPHYYTYESLLDGNGLYSMIPLAYGGLSGLIWLVALIASFEWMKREGTTGRLWRDWYAR